MPLDWMSFTVNFEGKNGLKQVPQHFALQPTKIAQPLHGYSKAWELRCGGWVMTPSKNNKRMKTLVLVPGSALSWWREETLSDDDSILRFVWANCAPAFTRLDYAIDTDDPSATPQELADGWRAGTVKTRMRTMRCITSERRNEKPAGTVYFGSQKSARQIVIYDKAKQLGLLSQAWTRVELRLKKSFAQMYAFDAKTEGAQATAQATLRGLLQTDVSWYNEMLEGKELDLSALGRKETKGLMHWLGTDVRSAIFAAHERGDPAELEQLLKWAGMIYLRTHGALSSLTDSEQK